MADQDMLHVGSSGIADVCCNVHGASNLQNFIC